MLPDAPDCVPCSACCFSELAEYVRVFGVDVDRMDERALGYTDFDGHRAFMRMVNGRCAALVIDPDAKRFTCAIYEMRPDVCRSLEPGSGACKADRHAKRERPLLAIEALLRKPSANRAGT
jgi:Fe-S-cluster containining protein